MTNSAMEAWLDSGGHDQFLTDLQEGLKWEFRVGCQLLKMGLTVRCSDLSIDRRPPGERPNMLKSTDLLVGVSSELKPVEVKSIRFAFGDRGADHPYPTTFVGPVSHWQAKESDLPVATIIVSQPTHHMFFVPTATKPVWEVRSITDTRRNIGETNYAAPKSCWFPLEDLRHFL